MTDERQFELIDAWRDSELTDAQADELNELLRQSKSARQTFVERAQMHGLIHVAVEQHAIERVAHLPSTAESVRGPSRFPLLVAVSVLAVAVALMVGFGLRSAATTVPPVATLVSSEDAAWESPLPTTPGSLLPPGHMKLLDGIATIRFASGAEVILEAPSHLVLETPMRGKLLAGTAVIDVPDSAIGFVMGTPGGYAVDLGTSFSVQVNEAEQVASFEVISGEISVHTDANEVRLNEQEAAAIRSGEISTYASSEESLRELQFNSSVVRLGTAGRATSIIENDRRRLLHPDLLMVKHEGKPRAFDRRSLMSFDLSGIDLREVKSVRLRLNMVPSGKGFAAHLPKINRFAVHGVTDETLEEWSLDCDWNSAPDIGDGVPLGTFEVARSRQRGGVEIGGEAILDFLKTDTTGMVTMLLVRETGERQGRGLVHAFASDSHAEASGPILEFTIEKQ